MTGSNRRLPPCNGEPVENETVVSQGVMATHLPVCTRVCTSKPEKANDGLPKEASPNVLPAVQMADGHKQDQANGVEHRADGADPLVKLAADLLTLSPAAGQRHRETV